jgi:hypothetical protein
VDYAKPYDLRVALGLPTGLFDADRGESAVHRASRSARAAAVKIGGVAKVTVAEADEDSDGYAVLRDVTLAVACRLYENPAGNLQERHGDHSVSRADPADTTSGLNQSERQQLRDAFGVGAGSARVS